MYASSYFQIDDPAIARDFVLANPFAILVTQGQRLLGSHIPLELNETNGQWQLSGHLSRANEQWKVLEDQPEAMAIFSGPHTYISSSWYSHYNVPTWNYQAAHVYGTCRLQTEPELRASLEEMVNKYESQSEHPLHMNDLPEAYIQKSIRGITGIVMNVEKVEVAFKLSQNRQEKDYWEIIRQLEKRGDPGSVGVAAAMRKHTPEFN